MSRPVRFCCFPLTLTACLFFPFWSRSPLTRYFIDAIVRQSFAKYKDKDMYRPRKDPFPPKNKNRNQKNNSASQRANLSQDLSRRC